MTRPADLPVWATAADALISTPPLATRQSGDVAEAPPPVEYSNWYRNTVHDWIVHMAYEAGAVVYDDLAEAIADTTPGQIFTVYEDDSDTGPGSIVVQDGSGASGTLGLIDCSGDLVVMAIGGFTPVGTDRDLVGVGATGTPIAFYTRTNSGSNYSCKTNGVITLIAYGNYVECFNATTGASLWVHDNTVPVSDMAIGAADCWITSGITSGSGDAPANVHLQRLRLTDGAVQASYRHSAAGELRSVCCNGRQVFVSGTASSYTSGATLRALTADTLYDATNEGGTAADDTGLAWNIVEPTIHGSGRVMACDDQYLYSGYPSAAALQIMVRGQGDGFLVWSRAHPDSSVGAAHVSVDQDYMYVCFTDSGSPEQGFVEAYSKRTGGLAWRWSYISGGQTRACRAAVSDGQAVYVLGAADSLIWRITRGNRPTRYLRVDESQQVNPYRRLRAVPLD